jgi:hypothetical protein
MSQRLTGFSHLNHFERFTRLEILMLSPNTRTNLRGHDHRQISPALSSVI